MDLVETILNFLKAYTSILVQIIKFLSANLHAYFVSF